MNDTPKEPAVAQAEEGAQKKSAARKNASKSSTTSRGKAGAAKSASPAKKAASGSPEPDGKKSPSARKPAKKSQADQVQAGADASHPELPPAAAKSTSVPDSLQAGDQARTVPPADSLKKTGRGGEKAAADPAAKPAAKRGTRAGGKKTASAATELPEPLSDTDEKALPAPAKLPARLPAKEPGSQVSAPEGQEKKKAPRGRGKKALPADAAESTAASSSPSALSGPDPAVEASRAKPSGPKTAAVTASPVQKTSDPKASSSKVSGPKVSGRKESGRVGASQAERAPSERGEPSSERSPSGVSQTELRAELPADPVPVSPADSSEKLGAQTEQITQPKQPGQPGQSGQGEQTGHSGESAEAGEAAPARSRRSRTRRGRRKSAAARAAAAAAAGEGASGAGLHADPNHSLPAAPSAAAESEPDLPATLSSGLSGQQAQPDEDLPEADQAGPGATDSAAQKSGRGSKKGQAGQTGQTGRAGQAGKEAAAKSAGKKAVTAKTPASAGKEPARNKRKMFVSVLPGEQVEVVLAEEGQVQEYYVEMLHQAKIKGNIYKGVIHNVDPNLQAAFVSYGAVKNGFLQIDEVHPEYYLAPHEAAKRHKYPLIQKVLKPGQEILVQVVKEPSGSKGAFLTSYLSLPGRFLVLTPGREQVGVSRKVDSEEERARLREMLNGLNPGEGLGVIVRTVSRGATKTSLQRDLQLLKRVWKDVRKKGSTEPAPSLIYQELALDTRAVRDYLTEEVTELWVDDEEMADQIRELVSLLFPRRTDMVQVHKDLDQTLFERFGLKKQLEQVHAREVNLPSGGRLVFDHTEALMAIDINSGRAAGKNNFEDTAFKTNLEAAQQIPLQLRLRDIGGQIVIDFIEMRDRSHWREVEKAIRNGMKVDRARHDVGKISSFGLLEIVRQRLSSSAISITSEPCPCCKGTGQRRNMEWQSLQALREIRTMLRKNSDSGNSATYCGPEELVLYLLNNKRERLLQMEKDYGVKLDLRLALDGNTSCKCK